MGKGEEEGGKSRKDKEGTGKREGASKGKGKMERIERISERERATKGQGKEKANHFYSVLLFTLFPLPCPEAIQLFNLSVLFWLAGGLPSQRVQVPLWGIGWYRLEYRLEGVTFSSTRSTKFKARWCNPVPHVNIHQEMWSDASPIWELLP